MRDDLEDLRILRLAQLYERAYEDFVQEIASRLADEDTRRRIEPLAPAQDDHAKRLQRHADRLRARLREEDREGLLDGALLDVVEVERAARAFYLQNADRVHDPAIARLFHDLAKEDLLHVRIAEDALDAHRRRLGGPS